MAFSRTVPATPAPADVVGTPAGMVGVTVEITATVGEGALEVTVGTEVATTDSLPPPHAIDTITVESTNHNGENLNLCLIPPSDLQIAVCELEHFVIQGVQFGLCGAAVDDVILIGHTVIKIDHVQCP